MTSLCLLVAMGPVMMAKYFLVGIVVLATFAHPASVGGKDGFLMAPSTPVGNHNSLLLLGNSPRDHTSASWWLPPESFLQQP